MPYVDSVFHEPAAAVARGRCPECGRDLAQSSYEVETRMHWPRGLDPSEASPEAIARAAMLKTFFETPPPEPALIREVK
jgi:hypothetical protein